MLTNTERDQGNAIQRIDTNIERIATALEKLIKMVEEERPSASQRKK